MYDEDIILNPMVKRTKEWKNTVMHEVRKKLNALRLEGLAYLNMIEEGNSSCGCCEEAEAIEEETDKHMCDVCILGPMDKQGLMNTSYCTAYLKLRGRCSEQDILALLEQLEHDIMRPRRRG